LDTTEKNGHDGSVSRQSTQYGHHIQRPSLRLSKTDPLIAMITLSQTRFPRSASCSSAPMANPRSSCRTSVEHGKEVLAIPKLNQKRATTTQGAKDEGVHCTDDWSMYEREQSDVPTSPSPAARENQHVCNNVNTLFCNKQSLLQVPGSCRSNTSIKMVNNLNLK
jgi:hypothetical protein